MGRAKGFELGHSLARVFSPCFRRRQLLLLQPEEGPVSRMRRWVNSPRRLWARKSISGYVRAGPETLEEANTPKGHLVVYVGDGEEDTCRVLVPVIYFNHPLFGELLREAEENYGFDHPGGIKIPCPMSRLENVQMKIAAASGSGSRRRRRR